MANGPHYLFDRLAVNSKPEVESNKDEEREEGNNDRRDHQDAADHFHIDDGDVLTEIVNCDNTEDERMGGRPGSGYQASNQPHNSMSEDEQSVDGRVSSSTRRKSRQVSLTLILILSPSLSLLARTITLRLAPSIVNVAIPV